MSFVSMASIFDDSFNTNATHYQEQTRTLNTGYYRLALSHLVSHRCHAVSTSLSMCLLSFCPFCHA